MILRIFKYSLWLLSFLLIAVYVLYLLLNSFFINEVKNTLVETLNQELETPVAVNGDVALNLWTHFPHLSIELNHLNALESLELNRDTLLKANKVYLLVNLQKLWRKEWEIEHLIIENGKLALKKQKNGQINYQFIKQKEKPTEENKQAISLKIKSAKLNNIELSYLDEKSEIDLMCRIHKLQLAGDFSADSIALDLETSFFVEQIAIKNTKYINQEEVILNGQFTLFQKEERYAFNNMQLSIGNNPFLLNGEIDQRKYSTFYNLIISGQDLNVNDFLKILPERFAEWAPQIESSGKFIFENKIRGYLNAQNNPYIEINYALEDAELLLNKEQLKLEAIKAKGSYNNGESHNLEGSSLSFDHLKFRNDGHEMVAQVFYKNFNHPYLILKLNGTLNSQHINLLDTLIPIHNVSGLVNFKDFDVRGRFINPGSKKEFQVKGQVSSNVFQFSMSKEGELISLNQLFLNFEENNLKIKPIEVELANQKLQISASFSTIQNWLHTPTEINFDGKIKANELNINALEDWVETNFPSEENVEDSPTPKLIGKLDLGLKNLKYNQLKAENIDAKIDFRANNTQAFQMNFDAMQGKAKLLGELSVKCASCMEIQYQVDSINIQSLFTQFENFDQNALTAKNLKGKLSSKGILNFPDYQKLDDTQLLDAKIHMIIKEGALIDFKPMESLSKFIKVEDLKNIQFNELENELLIKDGMIDIPEMLILSNAFNLALSGQHYFDNRINYLIKLNIYNVLGNKFRLRKNEVPDAEMIDTDDFNFYLRMKGTTDKPEISFDKQGVKDRFKQQKIEWRKLRNPEERNYTPREEKLQWDTEEELETIDWDE